MPGLIKSSVLLKKSDTTARKQFETAQLKVAFAEDALMELNRALAFAKSKKMQQEIYSKRANIYHRLLMHQQCLETIRILRKIQSPLPFYFMEMEAFCLNTLGRETPTKAESFFKLSYKASKHNTSMAKSIQLTSDKRVFTKKALKSGKIICVEKAYCGVVFPSAFHSSCANCLSRSSLNLIPCRKCPSAMFCSIDCRKAAERFHKFECGVLNMVHSLPIDLQIAIRSLFESLEVCDGSIPRLMLLWKLVTATSFNDTRNINKISHNNITILKGLKRIPATKINLQMTSTIYQALELYPNFYQLLKNDNEKVDFVVDFIKQQMTIDFMLHNSVKGIIQASGIHYLYNYMRHSCASNICGVIKDGKMYYITTTPIEKNTELFCNHLVQYHEFNKIKRQQMIKTVLGFKCKCIACQEDYQFQDLPFSRDSFFKLKKIVRRLRYASPDKARKMFFKNSKYINEHFDNFPCKEISMLQSINLECLAKMSEA